MQFFAKVALPQPENVQLATAWVIAVLFSPVIYISLTFEENTDLKNLKRTLER